MDCSTLWIYAIVYLIAGGVILKCFRKLNMRIASVCFCALFAVGLIYIPIAYGSEFIVALFRPLFADYYDPDFYQYFMQSPLLAFIPYFSVTSICTFVFALILGAATVILAVKAVGYVVRYIRGVRSREYHSRSQTRVRPCTLPVQKPKRIWIQFCRLLN